MDKLKLSEHEKIISRIERLESFKDNADYLFAKDGSKINKLENDMHEAKCDLVKLRKKENYIEAILSCLESNVQELQLKLHTDLRLKKEIGIFTNVLLFVIGLIVGSVITHYIG